MADVAPVMTVRRDGSWGGGGIVGRSMHGYLVSQQHHLVLSFILVCFIRQDRCFVLPFVDLQDQ